jgi:predicted GNAT family acetyltransferase
MNEIELKLTPAGRGSFFIETNGTRVAEMEIAIQAKNLIVYHTEVADALQGKGIASKLLAKMVSYARENNLKVVPLCAYVLAQFKRHPDQYKDIWNTEWHG